MKAPTISSSFNFLLHELTFSKVIENLVFECMSKASIVDGIAIIVYFELLIVYCSLLNVLKSTNKSCYKVALLSTPA